MKNKTKKIKIFSESTEYQIAEALKTNRIKRTKTKEFFVEGVEPINQAIENNWNIDAFLYSSEAEVSNWASGILEKHIAKKHIDMPPELLNKLSDKEEYSELLAIVEMKEDDPGRIQIDKNMVVVLIDRSASPGNLGTIIRTCNSLGVDGLIMTGHSVDLYDSKTIRSSVGTIFSTPVIRLPSHNEVTPWINKVKQELGEINIIGTTAKASKTLYEYKFKFPTLLLVGNETYGLSSAYRQMSDDLVKIPMEGFASSLNVASATSILLYEIFRQLS